MNSSDDASVYDSRQTEELTDIEAYDPLFLYGLPAGLFILVLLMVLLCYLICYCDRDKKDMCDKRTKDSKSKKNYKTDSPPLDVQTADPNQATRLLYTPEISHHHQNFQEGKKASNWSLYIDVGRRSLSRASSRTSGLAFYSDIPVDGEESDKDTVFVEIGNLTQLQVRQSSLQPIRRENSFNPS